MFCKKYCDQYKMYFVLVTIVSSKQWLKQEIFAKMSLLDLFLAFNLTILLTVFTFTLDKLHCFWRKYFHLCLTITASVFTFTILPWLLYNFVLTFTVTFIWYTLTLMLFDCSIFNVTVNSYFNFTIHCAIYLSLHKWLLSVLLLGIFC